ncbi:ATP-dependent zinc metalloprotease FtsH [bacterium]|nr:ATP-dependent zinc metalloprotease FtsH [bacterium]
MAKNKEQDRAVIVEGEITPETIRKTITVVAIVVLVFLGFQAYSVWQMGSEISMGEAVKLIQEKKVETVIEQGNTILIEQKDKSRQYTQIGTKTDFPKLLQDAGVNIAEVNYRPNNSNISEQLVNFGGLVLMGVLAYGVWSFVRAIQRQNATGGGLSSFGKSGANVIIGKRPDVTFKDIAGATEAKEEIVEIVDFLKNPKQFFEMGARIPRGVLLVGDPGTGKTLLARAVAGEAKVPFFHTSGPEFEEMLVGAGAARVRDLFKRAKNLSPAIIFIDEIDAVARRRGMDYKSSHSEQTLNQILVEMDGFEKRDAVIVIAATNRPDVLDPAILRPGRFDRNVRLALPDITERAEILGVHGKNKKFGSDVDLQKIAQFTVGFSGADLENVLNEAAILAVRAKRKEIHQEDIHEAALKVSMGPRRGSLMMSQEDLLSTAYHEAGHGIVGTYLKDADAIKSITVVPRGISLGMTVHDGRESHSQTKQNLLDRIAVLAAGRAAEELIYGKEYITTGASGDIEHASKIANLMIKNVGMSEKIGFVQFDKDEDFDVFSSKIKYSDKTAEEMDKEVVELMNRQYDLAFSILKREKTLLEAVAKELLREETMTAETLLMLVEKHGKQKPPQKEKPKLLSVSEWIKTRKSSEIE